MPFIKISGLTTATAVSATNQFEINQNSTSRSATVAQVAAYVRGTATDTVVLPAGTTTAPAIFPTGDTNTGIFFPAADTIAFTEGGVEVVRIDATGNVGIGTAAPGAKLGVADGTVTLITRPVSASATGYFGTSTNHPLAFLTNNIERMRLDTTGNVQFNSGYGSVATAFGCRAWVNFNGTGTVAIRASGNVSSITDNGTGDYTVNFTTAMPDTNYAWVSGVRGDNDNTNSPRMAYARQTGTKTTSALRLVASFGTGLVDYPEVNIAVFR